jgi:Secretion system C-terminal sorting domain
MKKLTLGVVLFFGFLSFASAQNVLLNSSFELWLDSMGIRMPFAWYTSEATDSGSALRVLDPHSGIYALGLNGSDTLAYALTASIGFAGHNYVFSGWCKSNSILAGSFIITWINLSQQLVGDPVIIPIYRSTAWRQYIQIVQCPDSAILVNVDVVSLPTISITVDDVTLTDTVLAALDENQISTINNPIKIYPNPCQNLLTIETPAPSTSFAVYNIEGKLINVIPQNDNGRFKINTEQLSNGIYFIKTTAGNRTSVHKIVIKR